MKLVKKLLCLILTTACAFSSISGYEVNAAVNDVVDKEVDSKVIDVTDLNTTIGNDIYMTNKQILSLECRANGDVNPNRMDLKDLYLKIIPDDKRIQFDFSAYKLKSELSSENQEIRIILRCSYNYAPIDTTITIKLRNNNVTLYRKLNLHVRNPLCAIRRDDVNMYSDETVDLNLQGMYASTYFSGTYDGAVDLSKATIVSSNPDVVSINNGMLVAQNEGTATVNVTYNESYKGYVLNDVKGFYEYDGLTYLNCPVLQTSFNVTVKNKIKGISFTNENVELNVGEFYRQLPVIESDAEGVTTTYTWKSSNPSVASIDDEGRIEGLKPGKATITAVSTDKSKSAAAFNVTVKDNTPTTVPSIIVPSDDKSGGESSTIYVPVEVPSDADIRVDGNGNVYYKADVPTGVMAKANKKDIKITWNNVSNAKSYIVMRKTGAGNYEQVGTTLVNSYTDTKVSYKNKYTYKIIAVPAIGSIGNSDASAESKVISFNISKPKIKITKKKGRSYILKIKGKRYSGYALYLSNRKKNNKLTAAVKGNSVRLSLKKGKTYYIKVRSYAIVNGKNIYSGFSKNIKIKVK